MANNAGVTAFFVMLTASCQTNSGGTDSRYQGVIEFDQRVVGFELPGRVNAVPAVRGAYVHAGDRLAALDPELETTTRTARASDVKAAEAQFSLVKAGTRVEEIRSVEA